MMGTQKSAALSTLSSIAEPVSYADPERSVDLAL
jgi:hypothetical protein